MSYETKFADFIRLCEQPSPKLVIIHNSQALGDDYEEIIESLNRLADAGKHLVIVSRSDR